MTTYRKAQQLAFLDVPEVRPRAGRGWLERAREVAAQLSAERGSIAAEDLRGPVPDPDERNMWGSVLCRPWFVPTGYRSSRHVGAHGRKVQVWLVTPRGRHELLGEPSGPQIVVGGIGP